MDGRSGRRVQRRVDVSDQPGSLMCEHLNGCWAPKYSRKSGGSTQCLTVVP